MTTRIIKSKRKKRTEPLEPRKTPVQARSIESVRIILEAAAQVFEKHGYAAGTTNRIAKRAGVSIGTLYQYFPNKEAIAVALIERHLVEGEHHFNDWVATALASQMTLNEIIAVFVEGMLDLHANRPRLHHVLLEETKITERLHLMFHEVETKAAKTFAGLLKGNPEVNHPSLEVAAQLLVQTVESLTHRFATHPSRMLSREKFAAELVNMISSYLKFPSR